MVGGSASARQGHGLAKQTPCIAPAFSKAFSRPSTAASFPMRPETEDAAVLLSVVIPVHNEAVALGEFLRTLIPLLESALPRRHEILVVDDGSDDGSADTASAFAGKVRIFRHSERKGSGAARKTGSRRAAGEVVLWVDGDGTYAPTDVLRLARLAVACDEVIGARSMDFGRWRGLRVLVKGTTAQVAGMLWRTAIPDLNSGLRAMRRDCLGVWLEALPDGFSCTTTATLAALNHGQRVRFEPIDYRARAGGSSSKFHPYWDTLRLWRAGWRCWRQRRRRRRSG